MYAIVEIAGLQYKVRQDQKLYVNRLQAEAGDIITLDKVLLTDDNGNVTVGAPVIEGVAVEARVLDHVKGDKVIVFKKKRRKGYQVKNGHRQQFTSIEIVSLAGQGKAPKVASKKKAKDLTVIEGIGPKVKELFNDNGIVTFSDLASKTAEDLKAILTPKGGRYASMNPGTWPKQAELAAGEKWDELKKWQDELNGGE